MRKPKFTITSVYKTLSWLANLLIVLTQFPWKWPNYALQLQILKCCNLCTISRRFFIQSFTIPFFSLCEKCWKLAATFKKWEEKKQKTNKWPREDCGCILCWWKVSRKDCWMEMIRQKLKQQKEKIQDENWT